MIISDNAARGVLPLLELETLEGLTIDAVRDAYRKVAKKTHPDAGGDAVAFANADRAKHLLLKWLERGSRPAPPKVEPGRFHEKCSNCQGSGRRRINRGFHSMTMVCGTCHGTGDAQFEADKSDTGR